MTQNNVNKCKEKILSFRNNVKELKIIEKTDKILIGIIESICDKLDKTIFSSFKKVTISEIDRFLKISTQEKLKMLK